MKKTYFPKTTDKIKAGINKAAEFGGLVYAMSDIAINEGLTAKGAIIGGIAYLFGATRLKLENFGVALFETIGKFGGLVYVVNEITQNSLDPADIALGGVAYFIGSIAESYKRKNTKKLL